MLTSVIPVAGLGTRSLPASKAIPKEMLPIYDRPIIQYVIEESVRSGAGNIVLVTSKGKSAIEDHFDISFELEASLQKSGKTQLHESVHSLARMIQIQTVRQKEQLGLGHAVLMAKNLVQKGPFAVLLGDDMVEAETPGVKQLINVYESVRSHSPDCGVVMLSEVPESEVSKYGICEIADPSTMKISRCIEKPKPSETSSRYAIMGRYLLPLDIFSMLENQPRGALGEIQLTDALQQLARAGRLYGCVLKGLRFDAGDRLGFLRANIHYYLKSPYKKEVEALLREMSK